MSLTMSEPSFQPVSFLFHSKSSIVWSTVSPSSQQGGPIWSRDGETVETSAREIETST